MNAERLHAILRALQKDLQKTKIESTLEQLTNYLQQQINQPAHPQPQQEVSKTVTQLYQLLESAPSNNFPPTWRQLLEETGCDIYLGNMVRDRIREIFVRNGITPSIALEEIRQIHAQIKKLREAVDNIMGGFDYLNIGSDQLEPGECEVGILIPRAFVNDRLEAFADELLELTKILGVFAEISTGGRPGFEIRAISSSDLSISLDAIPVMAASVAFAVERIVSLYKQMLEIRKLKNDLKQQGVPKQKLKGIEEYASSTMETEISALVPELMKRFCKSSDECRSNELKIELTLALKKIANRIDRGFNVEIRVQPEPRPETTPEAEELRASVEAIQSAERTLQFLKTEGDPILSLPESTQIKDKKNKAKRKTTPKRKASDRES
jgi:hypothetical protein